MKLITYFTASLVGIGVATGAFAAGGGSSSPSTKTCKRGEVYDTKTKKCVVAERATDDAIFEGARDAAYSGEFDYAIDLLRLAANQDDPRVLNYLGFAHRKLGRTEAAMGYYLRALQIDPNYNLARSYMGQGLVADGDMAGAREQLAEIRNRGGEGTWAYVMLENAITSGVVY